MKKLIPILLFLILTVNCLAIRLAIITDIHFGGSTGLGADAPYWRIGSTAAKRTAQYFRICKKYNPDVWVILGDIINTGGVAADRIDLFKAEIDSAGLQTIFNVDGFFAVGNHEYTGFGNDADAFHDQIGITYHGVAPGTKFWPGTANRAGWSIDNAGFRLVGLATAIIGGSNFDDGAYGCAAANNQDDWINDGAGPLATANPIIVFSHAQLTTINNIGAEEWDNGDEVAHALIRGDFEAKGSIKAVFSGHHHRGTRYNTGSLADIVNGIPYYGLAGSVRGRHGTDTNANQFYIFDINTSGSIRCWEFQRDRFGRSRYSTGNLPIERSFGRDRYTY